MRFFRERRIPVSFVDLAARPLAPAELRRFSQRFGAAALLDNDSRAYREDGLAHIRLDAQELEERLLRQPALLRLPLIRNGGRLSVGTDEAAWRSWLSEADG